MNKLVRPLWGVKLYDPVNVGDVDSSRCQIRRDKKTIFAQLGRFKRLEFVVNLSPLFLVDLAMQLPYLSGLTLRLKH